MAYNLYQVQMARAWAQRIDKENAVAERFWSDQALKTTQAMREAGYQTGYRTGDAGSIAPSSACPSGYTSKTSFLKDRLERLETELQHEREQRKRMESDLLAVRTAISKPGTPTGSPH